MALFGTRKPRLQAKVLPRFPAAVSGGAGISVTKDAGAFEIGLDFESLVENASPDLAETYLVIWNSETESYERVSLVNLATAIGS